MSFADDSRQMFQFTTELKDSFGSRRTVYIRFSHVSKQAFSTLKFDSLGAFCFSGVNVM